MYLEGTAKMSYNIQTVYEVKQSSQTIEESNVFPKCCLPCFVFGWNKGSNCSSDKGHDDLSRLRGRMTVPRGDDFKDGEAHFQGLHQLPLFSVQNVEICIMEPRDLECASSSSELGRN